jgi:hypothetical protein
MAAALGSPRCWPEEARSHVIADMKRHEAVESART